MTPVQFGYRMPIPLVFPPVISRIGEILENYHFNDENELQISSASPNDNENPNTLNNNPPETQIRTAWPKELPELPKIVEILYNNTTINEPNLDRNYFENTHIDDVIHETTQEYQDDAQACNLLRNQGELWNIFAQACCQHLQCLRLKHAISNEQVFRIRRIPRTNQHETQIQEDGTHVAPQSIPRPWRLSRTNRHLNHALNWSWLRRIMNRNRNRVEENTMAANNEQESSAYPGQIPPRPAALQFARQRFALGLFFRCMVILILFDASINTFILTSFFFFLYGMGYLDPIIELITNTFWTENSVTLDQMLNRLAARQRLRRQSNVDDQSTIEQTKNPEPQLSNQLSTPDINTITEHSQQTETIQDKPHTESHQPNSESIMHPFTSLEPVMHNTNKINTQSNLNQAENPLENQPSHPSPRQRAFYQLFVVFFLTLAPWWTPDPTYLEDDSYRDHI